MKITEIKQQVKRADRYSIYADGKYVFSLSESELLTSGIRIGREYTDQEFAELKRVAVEDKAYTRSLDLIARRMRSEWEVKQYLTRKEYDEDTISNTLNKLSDRGYINDTQFARAWVSSRQQLRSSSKRRLQQELKQKRVADDVIGQVLQEEVMDDRELLRQVVEKKRRQSKYQDQLKLMQYLSRQGFNYDDIKQVLAEVESDEVAN